MMTLEEKMQQSMSRFSSLETNIAAFSEEIFQLSNASKSDQNKVAFPMLILVISLTGLKLTSETYSDLNFFSTLHVPTSVHVHSEHILIFFFP